jgi:hypothetical protein
MTTKKCSMLLQLVRRSAVPPSFVLVRHVDRRLASQLRALEETLPPVMALETYSLLEGVVYAPDDYHRSQSVSDGVGVDSASVWRSPPAASSIAMSSTMYTTKSLTTFKAHSNYDLRLVKRGLMSKSAASMIARIAFITALMWRVGHEGHRGSFVTQSRACYTPFATNDET